MITISSNTHQAHSSDKIKSVCAGMAFFQLSSDVNSGNIAASLLTVFVAES